jgi:hypothetical protein
VAHQKVCCLVDVSGSVADQDIGGGKVSPRFTGKLSTQYAEGYRIVHSANLARQPMASGKNTNFGRWRFRDPS